MNLEALVIHEGWPSAMQAGKPSRTLGCLFDNSQPADPVVGQPTYDMRDDPSYMAEELMKSHELVDKDSSYSCTLESIFMSACCDGFFEEVRDPIDASMPRTYGPEIAGDLVALVEAAKRVARWQGQWAHGAFLELGLLDLFDVDGLNVILPAIERLVQGYRDAPFDIHNHHVLDLMVAPFVRFFEALRPGANEAQLRAFVMEGIRGRWPVTEDEVLASIARIISSQ